MTDHDRLDDLLRDSLPELPPEDIVAGVTPWRKAMKRVLWGLGLTSVTLNFLYLQYFLPTLGLVLGLLGFRALRRENRWLRACFVLTGLRLAGTVVSLVLNTTIWDWGVWEKALGIALLLSQLMNLFCLWQSLQALRKKAGLEPGAGSALALLLWYLAVCALALVGYRGLVIGIAMIIGYGFILASLSRLSGELDEAGYALCPAAVNIPDRVIVLTLCAVLAVGMALGYAFGGQYAMDWQPLEPAGQQNVAEIKARLLKMDFPDYVLEDLSDEDILQCEGALKLYTTVDDHPMGPSQVVTEYRDGVYHHTTVYRSYELRITGVAVLLPGEQETWKLIHHFHWKEDPGFWGTDVIRLRPSWLDGAWNPTCDVTGRVLMDREGVTCTAPYWSLAQQTYTTNGFVFGPTTDTSTFAAFSFPKDAENRRGYLTYTMEKWGSRALISSWFDYIHQQDWAQYPVQSAEEHIRTSLWSSEVFRRISDAIQFTYYEGEIS